MALLSLIDQHREDADVPSLVATFLGAHTLPPEFGDETAYVDYLIDQCLPLAAAHGARYADVFCERGYFSRKESRRYLEAAAAHGLRLRSHCDEFAHEGAAAMAAELGADSVDHCNRVRDDEIAAVVSAGCVTVACPATIAYLGLTQGTPVRRILDAGGTVAVASDFNPGTSPCFNMQTVAYFGRALFGLTAAEALYAVTIAPALSLRSPAGRIAEGAPADLLVLGIESPHEFGWQFGGNLASAVVHHGVVV
ncbi:MAG: amidohydrolase family protein, partial [Candidatus Eremiobacteraeota bacterium]|nr:amidohydrolase family protein [Candidatus Eremiobacteraeota bacterium]